MSLNVLEKICKSSLSASGCIDIVFYLILGNLGSNPNNWIISNEYIRNVCFRF